MEEKELNFVHSQLAHIKATIDQPTEKLTFPHHAADETVHECTRTNNGIIEHIHFYAKTSLRKEGIT